MPAMHAVCSCKHVSYSTWRLQVFQSLFIDAKAIRSRRSPILDATTPSRRYLTSAQRYQKSGTPNHVSSDRYNTDADSIGHDEIDETFSRVGEGKLRQVKDGAATSSQPVDSSGETDMNELIASLKDLTKEAQRKEQEEEVPFQDMENERLYTPTKEMRRFSKRDGRQQHEDVPNSLPESPLWRRQRPQHRPMKRLPTKKDNSYLEQNVWAQLLESPFRLCQGSRARVPSDFLVKFGMVMNPKDGQTYLMPDELGDLKALEKTLPSHGKRRLKAPRKKKDLGTKIRILPYDLLLKVLSKGLVVQEPSSKKATTKAGMVAKRLLPTNWRDSNASAAGYLRASKEYLEEATKQNVNSNKEVFDMERVQWKADIADRALLLMRHRVLLALNGVGNGVQARRKINTRQVMALRIPRTGALRLSQGKLHEDVTESLPQEFWNDMGDIEQSNAMTGGPSSDQDSTRPPIAIQPSEIEITEAEVVTKLEQSVDWLPGSFFMSIGMPAKMGDHVKRAESLKAETNSLEPLPESCYLTPMISINDTNRLPVFPLEDMLGADLKHMLSKVLAKHKAFRLSFWENFQQPDAAENGDSDGYKLDAASIEQSYLILVKPSAPGSQVLLREIWQLWRYLGGRSISEFQETTANSTANSKQKLLRMAPESAQLMQSNLESLLFDVQASSELST